MNPGYQEDQENKCFVGPSGNLLTKVYLNHEQILKSPVYLTNAARCATLAIEGTPKRKHYKQFFTFLHEDIEKIINHHGKSFLLCLGSHATVSYRNTFLENRSHCVMASAIKVKQPNCCSTTRSTSTPPFILPLC